MPKTVNEFMLYHKNGGKGVEEDQGSGKVNTGRSDEVNKRGLHSFWYPINLVPIGGKNIFLSGNFW